MKVATLTSHLDRTPRQVDLDWQALAAHLTLHTIAPCDVASCGRGEHEHATERGRCRHKYGPAWQPVELVEDGRRGNGNVAAVTAAVLDLDHATDAQLGRVMAALDADGLEYLVHSTHSHRTENGSYRVVIPFAEPVPVAAWPDTWQAINHQYAAGKNDPACKNPERIYFLPSAPMDAELVAFRRDGAMLRASSLLGTVGSCANTIPAKGSLVAIVAGGGAFTPPARQPEAEHPPVNLLKLRAALGRLKGAYRRSVQGAAHERADLLTRLLEGQPFVDLPTDRHSTWFRLASLMARLDPEPGVVEGLMALAAPSLAQTPLAPGDIPIDCGFEHPNDKCCYTGKLEHNLRKCFAQREVEEAEAAELLERHRSMMPADVLASVGGDWKSLLLLDEKGLVKSTLANASAILEHDPAVRDTIRFNQMSKDVELSGRFAGTTLDDAPVEVSVWLERAHRVKLGLSETRALIANRASRNPYDPLCDYLNALQWDGVPRIDRALIDLAGAIVKPDGRDITEYLERVSAMFFVSCVARALSPGCKVDTVLVLEARQGAGKSSFFRALGGVWTTSSAMDVRNKDAQMLISKYWLAELAELATLARTEVESIKAFLSQQEDDYRPPYGSAVRRVPRRVVFVGSTNADEYLHDPTGARRFWPVACTGDIRLDLIRELRDQLWAEAVVRYHCAAKPEYARGTGHPQGALGERWWFDFTAQEKVANPQTEQRSTDAEHYDWAAEIRRWWTALPSDKRVGYKSTDLIVLVLRGERLKVTRAQQMIMARALRFLGWRRDVDRTWHAPADWAPHQATVTSISGKNS